MLSIQSGGRGSRGARRAGLPLRANGTNRTHGSHRAGGASGARRLERGQQGEIIGFPRHAASSIYVGHIEISLIGHQLTRSIESSRNPRGGHTAAVAGRLRGTGLRPAVGILTLTPMPRPGRGTRRRTLGRRPGPTVRHFKVVALVTLHLVSFLRQKWRRDFAKGRLPSTHFMPPPAFLRPFDPSFPKNCRFVKHIG